MATRSRSRAEAVKAAKVAARSTANAREKVRHSGSAPEAEAEVVEGVPYIPSEEFQAASRRVAQRRSGLLKRLA